MHLIFQEDADFSHQMRMLPALAFVAEDAVVEAFEELADTLPGEADDVVHYFEDTYIGRPRNRRPRLAPKFALSLWNMHTRTQDELPRTNNSVEGWHCRFQSSINCKNPNFWKFLEVLKGEQALQQVHVVQMLAGHPAEPPRKKYADNNQRIRQLVQNRDPGRSTINYLRGIAFNIGI